MNYIDRYRLTLDQSQRATLDSHRDTCRQLYNHALDRFNQIPEDEGTVKQRVRTIRDELPDLKDWWDALTAPQPQHGVGSVVHLHRHARNVV